MLILNQVQHFQHPLVKHIIFRGLRVQFGCAHRPSAMTNRENGIFRSSLDMANKDITSINKNIKAL